MTCRVDALLPCCVMCLSCVDVLLFGCIVVRVCGCLFVSEVCWRVRFLSCVRWLLSLFVWCWFVVLFGVVSCCCDVVSFVVCLVW